MLWHQLGYPGGERRMLFRVQLALTVVMCAPPFQHADPPRHNSRSIWQDGTLGGAHSASLRHKIVLSPLEGEGGTGAQEPLITDPPLLTYRYWSVSHRAGSRLFGGHPLHTQTNLELHC